MNTGFGTGRTEPRGAQRLSYITSSLLQKEINPLGAAHLSMGQNAKRMGKSTIIGCLNELILARVTFLGRAWDITRATRKPDPS